MPVEELKTVDGLEIVEGYDAGSGYICTKLNSKGRLKCYIDPKRLTPRSTQGFDPRRKDGNGICYFDIC